MFRTVRITHTRGQQVSLRQSQSHDVQHHSTRIQQKNIVNFQQYSVSQRSFSTSFPEAPYRNREDFEKATSSHYKCISDANGTIIRSKPQVEEEAWHTYNTVANQRSQKPSPYKVDYMPAITYTGCDFNFLSVLNSFPLFGGICKQEYIASGKLYAPLSHTWSLNATWLMGLTHSQTELMALSDIICTDSAFTKELVCAFRAGYKISSVTYLADGHCVALLKPPTQEQAEKVKLSDFMMISYEDCVKAESIFHGEKASLVRQSYPDKRYCPPLSRTLHNINKGFRDGFGIVPPDVLRSFHSAYIGTHTTFFKTADEKPKVKSESEKISQITQEECKSKP